MGRFILISEIKFYPLPLSWCLHLSASLSLFFFFLRTQAHTRRLSKTLHLWCSNFLSSSVTQVFKQEKHFALLKWSKENWYKTQLANYLLNMHKVLTSILSTAWNLLDGAYLKSQFTDPGALERRLNETPKMRNRDYEVATSHCLVGLPVKG